MSDDVGASADQPDASASSLAGDESSAAAAEATSSTPDVPLLTRDIGVFEGPPSGYGTGDEGINVPAASRARATGRAAQRPRGWPAYTAFLVLVLLALVIRFALLSTPTAPSSRMRAVSSLPSPAATATAAVSPTDSSLPAITPNATLPVNTGGGPVPTPGPEISFTVTAAEISAAPTTYDGECSPPDTMIEHFQGGVYVPGTTPGGTITYRWRFSNGTVTPVQSVRIGSTNRPGFYGAANDQSIEGTWAVDPAIADGSSKWAEFEVLTPSHLLSSPGYFTFKCEFMLRMPSSSVSGGGGSTPPQYDCKAGGDQTFTLTGAINVFPDPHSHTITYHWLRFDGTQSPDRSVTLSPGQYSASVQPDIVVVSHAQAVANFQQYGLQPLWEKIVVTSSPGIEGYPASYYAWCQS